MIERTRRLFTLAEELADTRDPRLWRGLALGGLEAVLGAIPYVCLYLILVDAMADTLHWPRVLGILAVMFLSLGAQIYVGVRATVDIMTAAYALFGATRMRLADHIRRLPMGWFNQSRSGALTESLTGKLDLLAEIWSHFIAAFSGGVAIPICVGIFLLGVDWRLGLITMATLPLAFIFLALSQRLMQRLVRHVLPIGAQANAAIAEYIRAVPVLRIFGRMGAGFERLDHSLQRFKETIIRAEVLPAPLIGTYGATIDAGFALLLYVGAYLWVHESITADVLLLFLVVSVKFFNPLFDLGVSILLLRFGNQALSKTQETFALAPMPECQNPQMPKGFDIELQGVDFTYEDQKQPALSDINAQIPARSMTAIVGPSGSGKSTLAHLIARLWDIQKGSIKIGGVDLREIHSTILHQQVSMVFQDVILFSGTIKENILMGKASASDAELIAAAKAAQAHDFIMEFPLGYETPVGEGGGMLSGGQQQRISIARALLKDAPIVLLDEATASVDPAAEALIQRAIDALLENRTVIVIAHRLQTIQRADQILVLKDGALVGQGPHAQLLKDCPTYAGLWHAQGQAKGWRRAQSL